MERMNRFLLSPNSGFVVGTVISALVLVAVFAFGAPPVILLPATVIVGTAYLELRSRALGRLGRR
jgi:hypothetical protein